MADSRLLLSFYGDDFTGSTDSMEVLEWVGIPTLLFLEPPSPDVLASRFPHVRAVGVAGVSRSMSPVQMDADLPLIFTSLKRLGARVVHYKTCSTFDSSPTIGSIGHATDIGASIFGEQTVPLVVGSSGVEKALALHWQSAEAVAPSPVGAVKQLIVVSGSAAPMTGEQIQWAGEKGFALIRLNVARLVDPSLADSEREAAVGEALRHLSAGVSVVLYSACGPDDPHIPETKARLVELGLDPHTVGARLGTQQGLILRMLLEKTGLRRAIVTGGDTCGYAARQLGIYALSAVMPVAPGAPLCRGYSVDPAYDGLQISLKAGQVGKKDYFGTILRGSTQETT